MAADDDLANAVEALHQAYLTLRQISGSTTDAVVHTASATTYLFPEMQRELRRMERSVRHQAAEREAILDALPAQLAILDESGTVTAVNAAWRAFTRAQDDPDGTAAVGKSYLDVGRAVTGVDEAQERSIAQGLEQVLTGQSSEVALEYSYQTPDGLLWFYLSIVPLRGGPRTGAVVLHMDITERRMAIAREAELQHRIARLLDQAGVGILVHRDNVPVFVNPALVKMLGFDSQDEILALPDVRDLFELPVGNELGSRFGTDAQPEAIRLSGRVAGRHRDGRPVMFATRVFTMTWGTESAVCVMASDITDLLRVEDKLRGAQKLEAVGQLTGGLAHDFNNLLTVILGNGDLLVAALQDAPELARLAEQTVMMAERGAELTKRLLAFARLQPLHPQCTDVNRRLAALDDLIRRTLGARIEITMDLSDTLWPAMIDGGELDNAILNLSINARDAMPDGGHLIIRTWNLTLDATGAAMMRDAQPGRYVVVSVIDDGAGMTEATLARVFEPFFTTKDIGKGSGLGLSMVFGFVKQSQGHIHVQSATGQGTSVRLYLPPALGPLTEQAAPEKRGAKVQEPLPDRGQRQTILLVEDDTALRTLAESQLRGLGYEVLTAETGAEALTILQGPAVIDLLFSDIAMPGGISGMALAGRAARHRPGLPVLLTSGFSDTVAKAQMGSGGVLLLQKPYRLEDLSSKVRAAFEQAPRRSRGRRRPSTSDGSTAGKG